ncbi:MAG: hypothetical protein CMI18_01020 [Opitutaceae bacterium]|nr:hypothetical protein [Opitutaceae bacterium]|tara:strand:+ start:849 stop:1295 length:447 start_codon:yes stop_codon:yes gene_type:complete
MAEISIPISFIAEVFEVDYAKNTKLVNISTREFVESGDKQIIGRFIVSGTTPARVFIRAIGPSFPPDVENRLNDHVLELYLGADRLDINDNWPTNPRIAEIIETGIAPPNKNEAAIVTTLNSGPNTALVGGVNWTSGYAFLEIYYFPE